MRSVGLPVAVEGRDQPNLHIGCGSLQVVVKSKPTLPQSSILGCIYGNLDIANVIRRHCNETTLHEIRRSCRILYGSSTCAETRRKRLQVPLEAAAPVHSTEPKIHKDARINETGVEMVSPPLLSLLLLLLPLLWRLLLRFVDSPVVLRSMGSATTSVSSCAFQRANISL